MIMGAFGGAGAAAGRREYIFSLARPVGVGPVAREIEVLTASVPFSRPRNPAHVTLLPIARRRWRQRRRRLFGPHHRRRRYRASAVLRVPGVCRVIYGEVFPVHGCMYTTRHVRTLTRSVASCLATSQENASARCPPTHLSTYLSTYPPVYLPT